MTPEYSWNYIIPDRERIGMEGLLLLGEEEETDKSEFG